MNLICSKCNTPKKWYGKARRQLICPRCLLERSTKQQQDKKRADPLFAAKEGAAWRKRNPRSYLQSKLKVYGLTLEDYDAIFAKQKGVCGICKKPEMDKVHRNLCVDHERKTGKIRGLLCGRCNLAIGLLGHDPVVCSNADRYLKHFLKMQSEFLGERE